MSGVRELAVDAGRAVPHDDRGDDGLGGARDDGHVRGVAQAGEGVPEWVQLHDRCPLLLLLPAAAVHGRAGALRLNRVLDGRCVLRAVRDSYSHLLIAGVKRPC